MTVVSPDRKIAQIDGNSSAQMFLWIDQITQLSPKSGVGSPEGVVFGVQNVLYTDTTGATGSVLYVKRDASIAGDTTKGWILV